ncbi:type II toxin-antitoxin system CcdA family antitoxin [Mesorhizobium australicum]|uniref:Antitoxin CcdA n=1 Tax=Mesorhizobium australicum TaxID=536018 RepID=A0A1X7PYD9_9HYPH|nr:type II toxin-antitoxin system CcdA family antitoxin [Mesorhizobium australicum]SMH57337.1 antitoxin CcdA [Mesorhizobium australicum]
MPTKMPEPRRRATKLSLDERVVAEAKAVGLDVSRIVDEAISDAVRAEKNRRWKEENREALESMNEWVRENGLPLEKYRLF